MLGKFWVVLFVALAGAQVGRGLPLRSAPPSYPHESSASNSWISELPYILPALALLVTAGGLLFGCAWCFRHKDCKPEEGADNQLFTASATVQNVRNPPDSGFYEATNNNLSEDNNNGPISLRDIQNIANNNATAYISADTEQRNTASRESVVEFEPLPHALPREIGVTDPLERCADWFVGDDLPRNRLQYLREIGRGWFGRVVEGEIEDHGSTSTVAVKILNQNASLEDKARFLEENRLYKDVRHENVLRYVAKYLGEDPWLLMFELCSMDLQQYLETNRPKMAILNENGVPLKLICDVTTALTYLHSRGYLYGDVSCSNVLVRETDGSVTAVLGSFSPVRPTHEAPECRQNQQYTTSSEVWSLGTLIWEVSAWGASPVHHPPPPPPPDPSFPYSSHLHQVMQLCWDAIPEHRPTSAQVLALVHHLMSTRNGEHADGDFEARWLTLKPNSIPKVDEHIAIIHAPSTSHFSTDTLSIDDTGVSRCSSILSDQLSNQIKSESLNNLHGSLEDVRNIYLTHNEHPTIECHQGNIAFDDKEDRSDSSVDPWLKDIIAGSQDDVSYYKDVSDVIKNLDNILNSEKTSSSESSHQASPSRDNLSLDCKKEAPVQSSLVKSPGIRNFQNILESGLDEELPEDEDRETIGSLSHSFERHSDTTSQHTLENLTPDTPVKDDFSQFSCTGKSPVITEEVANGTVSQICDETAVKNEENPEDIIPKEEKRSVNKLPNLRELTVTSLTSVSEEQLNIRNIPSNSLEVRTEVETKSVDKSNKSNAETFVHKEKEASNEISNKTKKYDELHENVVEIASNLVENEVIKLAIESVYKMQEHRPKEVFHLAPLPGEMSARNECHSPHPSGVGGPSVIEGPKYVQDEIRITTLFGGLPTTHVHRDNQEHRHIIPFEQGLRLESNEDSKLFQNEFQKPKIVEQKSDIGIEKSFENEFQNSEVLVEQKSEIESNDVKETPETNGFKYEPGFSNEVLKPVENELEKPENIVEQKSEIETESKHVKETDESNDFKYDPGFEDVTSSLSETPEPPEPVQSLSDDITQVTSQKLETTVSEVTLLATEATDNLQTSTEPDTYPIGDKIHEEERLKEQVKEEEERLKQQNEEKERLNVNASDLDQGNDSTVYKDLINSTKGIDNFKTLLDNTVKSTWLNDESTKYLDLPSFRDNTQEFLHYEKLGSDNVKVGTDNEQVGTDNNKVGSSVEEKVILCASTPKEELKRDLSETVPNQEQKIIPESPSPFESPTKSLKTDTYEENSSVLGPYETSMEYKCLNTDIPKEELLAFSSNFNEINLATPSPLRDGNFLNEVPDVSEFPFDDYTSEKPINEPKIENIECENSEINEPKSENSESENYKSENSEAGTTKHVSPSTPPNSPGLLASTSQHKTTYLVDVDLEHNIPTVSHNIPTVSHNIPPVGHNIPSIGHNIPSSSHNINSTSYNIHAVGHLPLTSHNIPSVAHSIPSTSHNIPSTSHDIPAIGQNIPSSSHIAHPQDSWLDINEIEMQITSKLAMAENENNLNIEYSGPLTVESIVSGPLTVEGIVSEDDVVLRDNDAIPEAVLAGNGGSVDDLTEFSLDEACVKALRDELELKLPLAQVASIEPACRDDVEEVEGDSENDPSWSTLPPPPELVVCYLGGALSPIAEETRHQLSAYENDAWNTSNRTDSSESYLEPCNNSTDDITELPTATQPTGSDSHNHSTYTVNSPQSANDTYTVQRDVPSSKEITMSPDSLNSPYRKRKQNQNDPLSPIDDETYNKNDDNEINETCEHVSQESPFLFRPNDDNEINETCEHISQESPFLLRPNDDNEINETCEHISQESPFLLSPTTDTSVQGNGTSPTENATAISTLSKTTDTKQPEDGLSKATSIDSWCSNDTLYNVEENFDDLAIENDANVVEDSDKKEDKSEGTDTLNNDDKSKSSHCSTYIIHDSDSECDTFSPDSITEKDNYTYTKVKTETVTPSVVTTNNKSETNDTNNTQIVDLAYGTLPSYSSCTTEVVATMNDPWMLPQPEMIRRSPVNEIDVTSPKNICAETQEFGDSPNITQPSVKRMESVEITCLYDDSLNTQNKSENSDQIQESQETNAFRCDYKNMTPSVTSTPLVGPVQDVDVEAIPMVLPSITVEFESPQTLISPTNFNAFVQSAEIRHQDISNDSNEPSTNILTGTDTGLLLEGESRTLSKSYNSILIPERTPNYSDFESSALHKPQEVHSSSSQFETGISSGDFRHFETSVRDRPQDLSSFIDASSMFLNSERKSSSIALTSHSRTQENFSLPISPPNNTNLVESQPLVFNNECFAALEDEETDQPHSIIITEVSIDFFSPKSPITNEVNVSESPKSPTTNENNISGEANQTYDSHDEKVNETYNSHDRSPSVKNEATSEVTNKVEEANGETRVNGSNEVPKNLEFVKETSPSVETSNNFEAVNSSPKTSPTVENSNNFEAVNSSPKTSPTVENSNNFEAVNSSPKTSPTVENSNNFEAVNSSPKTSPTVENSNNFEAVNSSPKTSPTVENSNNFGVVNSSFLNQENHDTNKHNGSVVAVEEIKCNGAPNYATVNFINETFEEILDSDDDYEQESKNKDLKTLESPKNGNVPKSSEISLPETTNNNENQVNGIHDHEDTKVNGVLQETKMAAVTEDFLQNEKDFCRIDSYLPLLSDIRFSGPTSEIMSTSFTQDSPTEPESPECEQDNRQDTAADICKEWDSDTDSHSSHSNSEEFIWKGGDGRETALVPTDYFDHQRSSGHGDGQASEGDQPGTGTEGGSANASGDSGSGSEGDEVEFVPSSWDCRAEPAKSSLRSLHQVTADSKKRVVFKRQKYHCVYEYPREAVEVDTHSPAYLPDFSTYCEWDPSSAEDVEMGYGQLFGAPSPLDMYPLRGGYGADYDEDFFISSSARPFEALGVMSTASQFFPGMHAKALQRDLAQQMDDIPAPPAPAPAPAPAPPSPLPTYITAMRTPSLDFTTPDSGMEDITPGSTITDEDFSSKKLDEAPWKPADSTSSSESVSPSSPGGEALGGLRHTRDKLKLDLPPSPHIPSPRHNRVFNFILDKPRRRHDDREPITPLVMTDETPIISSSLPLDNDESTGISSEPTFSTFGKVITNNGEAESKIVLDEVENRNALVEVDEKKDESQVKETVKGEGTVLDSGDEDSGIESSSKASLERKTHFSS